MPSEVLPDVAEQDETGAVGTREAVRQVLGGPTRQPEKLYGTAGVEHLLAASKRFDVKWDLSVSRMGLPVCRDNVIQVNPDTGEIVRLRCDEESKTPPSIP